MNENEVQKENVNSGKNGEKSRQWECVRERERVGKKIQNYKSVEEAAWESESENRWKRKRCRNGKRTCCNEREGR